MENIFFFTIFSTCLVKIFYYKICVCEKKIVLLWRKLINNNYESTCSNRETICQGGS